jgi:NADPH:quinone reductase-like Zn-dependent oxidoreductase
VKAVVVDKFGGVDTLRIADVADPSPGPTEVLIRVDYAGVNPVDYKIRQGHLKDHLPHELPLIPGWDAAGVVESVGAKVTGFSPGDRVFAYCRKPVVKMGAYAELIAVEEAAAAKVPGTLSAAAASTVPLVSLTAWQALTEFAGLRSGESVLIHGGAGGVGGYGIQFARHLGAKVYSTAGKSNLAYLKELGAHHPLDYTAGDVGETLKELEPAGVDVVFDAVGGETLARSYSLLKTGGRLVSIVDVPDAARAAERKLKAGYHFVYPNGRQLADIAALLESGKVRGLPFEELPISQVRLAHEKSESRHVRGKLTLKVRGGF